MCSSICPCHCILLFEQQRVLLASVLIRPALLTSDWLANQCNLGCIIRASLKLSHSSSVKVCFLWSLNCSNTATSSCWPLWPLSRSLGAPVWVTHPLELLFTTKVSLGSLGRANRPAVHMAGWNQAALLLPRHPTCLLHLMSPRTLHQLQFWLFVFSNWPREKRALNRQLGNNNMSVTLTEVWSSAGQNKVGRSEKPATKYMFVACLLCHTPLGALEVPLYNQRDERVATGY